MARGGRHSCQSRSAPAYTTRRTVPAILAAWRLCSARICDLPSHVSTAAVDAERARGDEQRHAMFARVTAYKAVGVVTGGAEHGRAIPASNSERSSRGSLHLAPAVHHCAARLNPPSERNQCTCCERLRYSQKVPFGWRHSAEHGACRRQGAARWRGHTRPCEVHWSRRKLRQLLFSPPVI